MNDNERYFKEEIEDLADQLGFYQLFVDLLLMALYFLYFY